MKFKPTGRYQKNLYTKEPQDFKIPKKIYGNLKRTFDAYIEKYFHDDVGLWNRRREPYMFYKHMFRKFALKQIQYDVHLREFEEKVCGNRPNHTTIKHSRDIDPNTFKLTKEECKEIIIFLNKHFHQNMQQKAKTLVMEALNRGYVKEDVARHCMVHPDVIDKLLKDERVSTTIAELVFRELSYET